MSPETRLLSCQFVKLQIYWSTNARKDIRSDTDQESDEFFKQTQPWPPANPLEVETLLVLPFWQTRKNVSRDNWSQFDQVASKLNKRYCLLLQACFNSHRNRAVAFFAPSCAEVRCRKLGRLYSETLGVKRCTEGTRLASASACETLVKHWPPDMAAITRRTVLLIVVSGPGAGYAETQRFG